MSMLRSFVTVTVDVRPGRSALVALTGFAALLLILGAFLLVAPNAGYVQLFLDDVIGLIDCAYLVSQGKKPSVDFRSLYGAALHYPAALGLAFDLQPGAVQPCGACLIGVPLVFMTA